MPKQTFFNLPEDKRQWILDRAVAEFAEQGYSGASISRIVAEAKIAKGSFYQYFEGKEDLYAYIIDHAIVSRKRRISDEEVEKLKNITLFDFLRIVVGRSTREFSGKPEVLKIAVDYWRNHHEPVQKRIALKYLPESENYFKRLIQDEKSRNEIDANVDDDMLSNMIMGAYNEIVSRFVSGDLSVVSPEYMEAWVDRLEYILANGIFKNTAFSPDAMCAADAESTEAADTHESARTNSVK